MRFALVCLALIFASCASVGTLARTSEASGGDALCVVSFNIRYATPRDGDNRWELRRELVVETLRAHAPDLFGLQEALPQQTSFVAAAMGDYEHYSLGRRGDGVVDEACPVFWRRARFDCEDKGTFWLGADPERIAKSWDAALPRICSWLRLRDRATGSVFVFANAHFDHRGERAREESAALLARRWPGERVILVGDLNAGEASRPLARLREGGFVDSFRALHPDADFVGTYTGFRVRGRKKIDYVLTRGAHAVEAASLDDRRPGGRWPSDHLPVAAKLRWLQP